MLWSILICAIPERYHSAQYLLYSLLEQQSVARMPDVELIYIMDNRRRSVGAKRNDLLAMARGEYISFIDDDDEIATDYVQKIYRAITKTRKSDTPADVICFPQRAKLQPTNMTHECTYSLAYWKDREPEARRQLSPIKDEKGDLLPDVLDWTGPPAHTMVWRRAILEGVKFPEKNFGEDVDFVDVACELAQTEMIMNGQPLYYYHFSEEGTTTR